MDFQIAMQDVYDLFNDINSLLVGRGLRRLDDMLRPAAMSGVVSDLLTASLANHARTLTENRYFNGHPDLLVEGAYSNNAVQAGTEGAEIKSTRKAGGAVDMHGARDQWLCVFVYAVDNESEPARARRPMVFTESISRPCAPTTFGATSAANEAPGQQLSTVTAYGSCASIGYIGIRHAEDHRPMAGRLASLVLR